MVDVAVEENLSASGIQGAGGWTTPTIPLGIYHEAENKAGRREARPVRARMLGEDRSAGTPNPGEASHLSPSPTTETQIEHSGPNHLNNEVNRVNE